ncbi:MAG: alpha-1,2-fucosyltransferase [Chitinophagaceae bacterium]|nr:MAG: alpha-1,2-fucosyltransferase [Chitinophagaceae bacterium]
MEKLFRIQAAHRLSGVRAHLIRRHLFQKLISRRDSMIIVQLKGGLGNQMFQYAAARALAARHRTQVLLDTAHYRADQLRNFDLFHLQVAASTAAPEDCAPLKAQSTFSRLAARLTPYSRKRFYKQPFYHFDPHFFELGPDVYLQGYFQSERYFAPLAPQLREEFRFRDAFPEHVRNAAGEMRAGPSVSLHIRRGDYRNPETLRVHGILPFAYYEAAIRKLQERIGPPAFYVFTDDPQWVAANLDIPGARIVSGATSSTHFEDLYLMSHCRHHILANSSFSWWGAWLNTDPGKIVIAPRQWFNEGPVDLQDLMPAGWERI